jgi:L-threonate 2-dehydrogenase
MFQNRVPHILAGDYTPRSAVNFFVKELGHRTRGGKRSTFPLPLTAAALQMFLMAAGAGYGGEGEAAVVNIFPGIVLPHA